MENEVFQLLSASGDVAVWLIALGFYKLDKRISRVEWNQDQGRRDGGAAPR